MVRFPAFVFPIAGTAALSDVWVQEKSQKCWSIYTEDYYFGTVATFVFWLCFVTSWATVLNTIQFR